MRINSIQCNGFGILDSITNRIELLYTDCIVRNISITKTKIYYLKFHYPAFPPVPNFCNSQISVNIIDRVNHLPEIAVIM